MMVVVQVIAVEVVEVVDYDDAVAQVGIGWWHLRSIPALLRVGAGPLFFPPAINT